MRTIKVKCIKQFKQLEGVLDINDEVEIVTKPQNGKYNGYSFTSKNGETYSNRELENQIGLIPLSTIFKKL